jgi:hypothetical protein
MDGWLSAEGRSTAGILLLTIVLVEYGGLFMLRVARGAHVTTPLQQTFYRAGHAHAGVLVILSLVVLLTLDAAGVRGPLASVARGAVPLAAILMPAGFFLSAAGAGRTTPGAFIWLLYAGAASLALGVASLGIALLTL